MESPMEDISFHGKQRPVLLIADKDDAYCRQVRRIFEPRCQVVEASDGERAFVCIASYENKIGAAIISLTPSESDGFQMLEILWRERAVWNTPVTAASWGGSQEEQALGMEADEFLRKPHTAAILERRTMRAMRSVVSRERERMLEGEARQDYPTGLLDRRDLEAAVSTLDGKGISLVVYLFGLDNSRHINDTSGHVGGDRTISAFVELLREQTRESDVLSRFGGDESVVIMKQMRSREDAVRKGRTYTGTSMSIPSPTVSGPATLPVSSSETPGSLCRPYWSIWTRPCAVSRLKIEVVVVYGKTGMNIHKIRRPCTLSISILW